MSLYLLRGTYLRNKHTCLHLAIWLGLMVFTVSCSQEKKTEHVERKVWEEFNSLAKELEEDNAGLTESQRFLSLDSLSTIKRFQFTEARQRRLLQMSALAYRMGNFPLSLLYADSLVKLGNPLETGKGAFEVYIDGLYQMGDLLVYLGRYRKAFDIYFEAKQLGEEYFENKVNANFNYRMGMALYRASEYENAYIHFNNSLKQHLNEPNGFKNFCRVQELMNNKSLCLQKVGKLHEALEGYDSAYQYVEAHEERFRNNSVFVNTAKAVIEGNRATIYWKLRNYERAEAGMVHAIEVNMQDRYDKVDALKTMMKLIAMYHETGDFEKAEKWLKRCISLNPAGFLPEIQLSYLGLASAQSYQNGLYRQAADFGKRYLQLTDSLERVKRQEDNIHVMSYVDALTKKEQVEQLAETNKLQQKLLITFIIFGSIVAGLIIMLVVNLFAMRRKNQMLSHLNQQVNKQQDVLETNLAKVEKLNAERERITAIVVHDLRNPVSAIKSLTQLFDRDQLKADDHELLNAIEKSANNALELMNEVMQMTDLKNNKELDLKSVDLVKLVEQATESLKLKAQEKGVALKLKIKNRNILVLAHEMRFTRVVENLVSNAIKFSDPGDTVKIEIDKENNKAIVSVQDEGIGIPEKYHADLFNIFTPAKRKGTANEPTFGLGLSIVKEIVDAHQGKVYFESKEGVGTTFFLEMALAESRVKREKAMHEG